MRGSNMDEDQQKKMLDEMVSKVIFNRAKSYAFDYADNVLDRTVFPTPEALQNLQYFTEDFPKSPGDALEILAQLHQYGSPATVSQTGGRYFGFVNGGVVPVALATRWLTDFWDQNAALHIISPVAAKLEEVCETWLKQLFGLSETFVAGFVSGSSTAIFAGLAAGRYRILQNQNWDVNRKGMNGAPEIRVVAGREAHGTVTKALALLGIGTDNVAWVDTDEQGRIIPALMPILDDRTIIVLQAGNVNSGAFDAIDEICNKANVANAWVHVDGAFGLWAAGSAQLRHLTGGIEKANSLSVDGHKTLNTPYDCGIVLCADKQALAQAMQASGSYITYGEHRDGMLYTPEMSRRARAVELWAVLKYLGRAGVDALVSGLHARALQMQDELKSAGFQILNDVVFNQIVICCESDAITQASLSAVQQSGECWMGGSVWRGRAVIRISICSWVTTANDVTRAVNALIKARAAVTSR